MTTKRKRRGSKDRLKLRAQLFKLSKGKCYYCKLPLVLRLDPPPDLQQGCAWELHDDRSPSAVGGRWTGLAQQHGSLLSKV